jgi:hypothetical protein
VVQEARLHGSNLGNAIGDVGPSFPMVRQHLEKTRSAPKDRTRPDVQGAGD